MRHLCATGAADSMKRAVDGCRATVCNAKDLGHIS
jgi:hypothetical protein